MVEVTKEGTDFIIKLDESEIGVADTGLIGFLMSSPCRIPEHSHEQILLQLLKLSGIQNQYTTVQREKLRFAGRADVLDLEKELTAELEVIGLHGTCKRCNERIATTIIGGVAYCDPCSTEIRRYQNRKKKRS